MEKELTKCSENDSVKQILKRKPGYCSSCWVLLWVAQQLSTSIFIFLTPFSIPVNSTGCLMLTTCRLQWWHHHRQQYPA